VDEQLRWLLQLPLLRVVPCVSVLGLLLHHHSDEQTHPQFEFTRAVRDSSASLHSLIHLTRARLVHGEVSLEEVVLLTWTIAFSASISVGILLGWHIYLIATNQVVPHMWQ
jgi:hypothetical protein